MPPFLMRLSLKHTHTHNSTHPYSRSLSAVQLVEISSIHLFRREFMIWYSSLSPFYGEVEYCMVFSSPPPSLWRCGPTRAMASSFLNFLDHTQRRITVGRTPLEE